MIRITAHATGGGRPGERGTALVGVLLLLLLMSALAAALGVSGRTETLVARNHQSLAQARVAAEAGLNQAIQRAVTYLRTIDPVNIPNTLDSLLVDTSALTGVAFATSTAVPGAADPDATYELLLMDEDDPDREDSTSIGGDADLTNDEDGNEITDNNRTLVIRAVGHARNNTSVVLEALIAPVQLGAIVTDGDLTISGSVTVTGGAHASVHSNGDLTVDGGSASVSGDLTASGEYDGPAGGSGGAPEKPLPRIRAEDYKHHAQYVLSDDGLVLCNQSGGCGATAYGGTVCDSGNSGNDCRGAYGWQFDGPDGWSMGSAGTPLSGTFYVEGAARISSSPTLAITLIAEGSIDISGSPVLTAHTDELLFVTDGDLDISGGVDTDVVAQGQMLVHEQISISGNATLGGQLVVEDAASVDPLVENNSISGSVTIDYNGTLGTNLFFVTAWREVR
ncbi:MAG: hypothetical protein A3I61_02470 [Acidobacteria bacterium RIFCSPLOWO2_02_FULL_68_18]|nr:MAG: hypothetical protein A3I61_02470 [Acidobacteria bacterium RIFCSPLOWO2_02_FULL_68_18]OFW51683.1 MAG: hypothetical protein A3G77_12425 [Acidobacteria bacterium RIFCSPLOWO2_12_FULL_68_19]